MATSTKKQPTHTLLDDIRFQTVKANNKRTSFVSSDYQIVAQKAQVLKGIEKCEKLVNADFRRQQNVLLKKLDKLQYSRENTIHFNDTNSNGNNYALSRRRHSAPCLEKSFFISRQTSVLSTTTPPTPRDRKSSNSSEGGNSVGSRESLADDITASQQWSRAGANKISIVEARRRSYDIQAETSKLAMKRLESIVSGQKRRATIAEGATHSSLIPPSTELLRRLSRVDVESEGDEEDDTDQ